MRLPIVDLWAERKLIFFYSLMNIKIRHRGSYLGLIWIGLEPLLLFIFLYMVFTGIRASDNENFGVYLLSGLVFYYAFAKGTLTGLNCLRDNYHLLISLKIKKEFFPLVSVTTTLIQLIIEIGILFGIMLFFQFIPPWTIIFIPIVVGLLLLLILGMTYLLSVLFVYLRDILPVWAVIVHALFFLNPIFWYVENIENPLLFFHNINPLGILIEIFHKVVIFGVIPEPIEWAHAAIPIFFIFVLGFIVFRKLENKFLEVL